MIRKRLMTGLSLIEVLVALTITTLSIMGLTTLQLENLRNSTNSEQDAQAIYVVDDIINRINANSSAKKEYLTSSIFGNESLVSCEQLKRKTKRHCSSYHDGYKRVRGNQCNASEQAIYDLFSILCQQIETTQSSVQGSQHSLIQPKIKIENINRGELKITLQWQRRSTLISTAKNKNPIGVYQVNIIP